MANSIGLNSGIGAQTIERYGQVNLKVPSGWAVNREADAVVFTDTTRKVPMIIIATRQDPARGTLAQFFAATWASLGADSSVNDPQRVVDSNGWEILYGGGTVKDKAAYLTCYRIGTSFHAFVFYAPYREVIKANERIIKDFVEGISPVNAPSPTKTIGNRADLFGDPDGFSGVYVGRGRGQSMVFNSAYIVLFKDGSEIEFMPTEGFDQWSIAIEKRRAGAGVQRWEQRGNKLVVVQDGGTEWVYSIDNGELNGSSQVAGRNYRKVNAVSNLRLSGKYSRRDNREEAFVDRRNYPNGMFNIVFNADGSFVDNMQISQVYAHPMQSASMGDAFIEKLAARASGTYEIANHTIRLTYSDGRVARLAFYVPPGVAVTASPTAIFVGIDMLTLR